MASRGSSLLSIKGTATLSTLEASQVMKVMQTRWELAALFELELTRGFLHALSSSPSSPLTLLQRNHISVFLKPRSFSGQRTRHGSLRGAGRECHAVSLSSRGAY